MGKYFGTDGVRGVAGADLTCEMAMMIGRGVYLPFYMSLTAFLGSCVKLAYDKWAARRDATAGLSDEEKAAKDAAFQEQGLVVASGLLGGESIVGVILAFISVGLSLLG